MAKQGLGKGLGALLDDTEYDSSVLTGIDNKNHSDQKSANENHFIDVSLLQPNPHQPRTQFDEHALQELANSIREHGIIQPIVAEEIGDGRYYIIAGERRTRAAKLAGLSKVPVYVKKFSDKSKLEVALIENIQRENLNPIEEARAYKKILEMGNLSQDEVAKRVGKNRSTVTNALRLLKLPEDMQTTLTNGALSAGHARALLSVINPSDQRVLFARIAGSNISVRDAEEQASRLNGGGKIQKIEKKQPVPAEKNADLNELQEHLIETLGTKVSIKGDLNKGSIHIDYFSQIDLERLYDILNKKNTAPTPSPENNDFLS
ncbi:MAG: ParB/RepB/Spo0J family partition protein [Treponemataceae bacterium]